VSAKCCLILGDLYSTPSNLNTYKNITTPLRMHEFSVTYLQHHLNSAVHSILCNVMYRLYLIININVWKQNMLQCIWDPENLFHITCLFFLSGVLSLFWSYWVLSISYQMLRNTYYTTCCNTHH
jgi:hypothetical protein